MARGQFRGNFQNRGTLLRVFKVPGALGLVPDAWRVVFSTNFLVKSTHFLVKSTALISFSYVELPY